MNWKVIQRTLIYNCVILRMVTVGVAVLGCLDAGGFRFSRCYLGRGEPFSMPESTAAGSCCQHIANFLVQEKNINVIL
jgi:hypothetical protein